MKDNDIQLNRPYKRSNFPLAIMVICLAHVLVFGGLFLFQGCGPSEPEPQPTAGTTQDIQKLIEEYTKPSLVVTQPSSYTDISNITQISTQTVVGATSPPPSITQTSKLVEPLVTRTTEAGQESRPPSATVKLYKVEPGDYPIKIAQKFGISVEELMAANPSMDPRRLRPGQELVIPPPRHLSTTTSSKEVYPGTLHKVQPGDTLIKIARQYGVTVEAIREENELKSDRILVGQTLKIPTHKK